MSRQQHRSGRMVRVAGAVGVFLALGGAPLAAPTAHADIFDFDWLTDIFSAASADVSGAADALSGSAAATDLSAALDHWFTQPLDTAAAAHSAAATDSADSAAPAAAAADSCAVADGCVPISVNNTTEPVADISVGGGAATPVLIDTGSNGLVIPWQDVGLQNLLQLPTSLGIGNYAGGMGYFYLQYDETIGFGGDLTTTPVPVDVVLFSWPTTAETFADGAGWSLPNFLGSNTHADGILGIAPDAVGPNTGDSVISALPTGYNDGVLIDEPAGRLIFGAPPANLTEVGSVDGVANTNLSVSVAGGAPQTVPAIIDSGGVTGTIQSSVPGVGSEGQLAPGTTVAVSTPSGQPLYSYTTANNGLSPIVISPTDPNTGAPSLMNTGYYPFSQMPVYIGVGPNGAQTIFYSPPIEP